jgi:hypothetical protein
MRTLPCFAKVATACIYITFSIVAMYLTQINWGKGGSCMLPLFILKVDNKKVVVHFWR